MTMAALPSPLARSVWMKSSASTSAIEERVVRIMMPSGVIASAMIGMTAYFACDQRNQVKFSEPCGPIPVAGSHPSCTAKMITRTRRPARSSAR